MKIEISLKQLSETPAFLVGFALFAVLFQALRRPGSLLLEPDTPLQLDLNTLLFYIFPHSSWFHLALNLVALLPLLAHYERTHGTVYTGVTVNLLAVVTGLLYCVPGLLLYRGQKCAGLLGIAFSLLLFFCLKESEQNPIMYTVHTGLQEWPIPTLWFPLLNAVVAQVLVPSSSFWGHLAAIGAGYLLALNYLKFLFPPLAVLLWIEARLDAGIRRLKTLVDYTREEEAAAERSSEYKLWIDAKPQV